MRIIEEHISNSVAETFSLGRELAKLLISGSVVAFEGDLGSGKTTLALRIAAELRKSKDSLKLWYPIVFAEES